MKQYFNFLPSIIKNKELIPYIWRWQYSRFTQKFSFLPKVYAPFENLKIHDDKIIYDIIIKKLESKTRGGGL